MIVEPHKIGNEIAKIRFSKPDGLETGIQRHGGVAYPVLEFLVDRLHHLLHYLQRFLIFLDFGNDVPPDNIEFPAIVVRTLPSLNITQILEVCARPQEMCTIVEYVML